MLSTIILVVLLVVIVLVAMIMIGFYNQLVRLRNFFKNAYAQIDVQLKRRYDLIPNLVETAKGYLEHEKDTLEGVIKARSAAVDAAGAAAKMPGDPAAMQQLAKAETGLGAALGRLFALNEQYPNLKADQTMARLSEELATTENRVAFSRQAYNDCVNAFNIARETFPAVLFAGSMGFLAAQLLESTESEEERRVPKVQF